MTVKELKEILFYLHDDLEVIVSKDSEGNGFSPLSEVDTHNNVYIADSSYSGEIGIKTLTPDLVKKGYTEEDVQEGQDCIILWPTN